MYITIMDELGTVIYEVTEDGVSFCDGKAYFEAVGVGDMVVDIRHILSIM